MGVKKIMMIRHAEKPGPPTYENYSGINSFGQQDYCSLIPRGWERGGAIANLFCPDNNQFQRPYLVKPDIIFAASPGDLTAICTPPPPATAQNKDTDLPSKRPYETVMALNAKLALPQFCFNYLYESHNFSEMVQLMLAIGVEYENVLISWQHQLILPESPGSDCVVDELLDQTNTPRSLVYERWDEQVRPPYSWPGDRYDMVLYFERPSGTGPFTFFAQVPQLLLDRDVNRTFPNIYPQNPK